LITTGQNIEIPPESTDLRHNGSMVVVIGREARNVSIRAALDCVFGVAAGNDITEASWPKQPPFHSPVRELLQACDTWGPIGENIVTGLNYNDLGICTRVNGCVASAGRTSEMLTSVAGIVHYLSHYATLVPGDLIFTGAPVAVPELAALTPGDVVEVEIDGVGMVRNGVVRIEDPCRDTWWDEMAGKAATGSSAVKSER
jgi:2-keto-4-pentenoate hydratase/2-oxohepta-3-ene-1,7-dioic acid hydratase in catechol pathway